MGTKTASVRLDEELYDRIDGRCVSDGCSRNDFIKNAIESALDSDEHKPHNDSYGNYWTWNKERKIWTCHVNMDNVQVTS